MDFFRRLMVDEPVQSEPIKPLESGGIRRGIYLSILAVLQSGIVAAWIAKKTGFSTKLVSVDDLQAVWLLLTGVYSAAVAAYVGVRNIRKRIEVGKDPDNPAPPIQSSALVQRLTK